MPPGRYWHCHSVLCVRNAGPGWPVGRRCNCIIWPCKHLPGGDLDGRADAAGVRQHPVRPAIRQHQRLGVGLWRSAPAGFAALEQRRSQRHDLHDRRYPGRRLQLHPAVEHRHRARRARRRRRLYLFQSGDRARILGVLGFTYNFQNQSTQYQNGVDMHFDWGASQFLTKQFQVGLVGYVYKESVATAAPAIASGASSRRWSASARSSASFFPSARCRATSI